MQRGHLFARGRMDCTFAAEKAVQIQAIAQQVVQDFGGELPCDEAVMRSFRGVGPKCANLALGIGCGQARISVPFGKHICTGQHPKCAIYPLLAMCKQVGVTSKE